jgi:hypothetical protein
MRKTNLAEALQKHVEEKPRAVKTAHKAETATAREGKKTIAGWYPLEVSKQLKIIGINNGKTIQELLTEALNDLFTKYGKAPIA